MAKNRKFRLALVDDLTQDHLWKIHFSKLGITVVAVSAVLFLFFVAYALIAFTPIRTLVPGYPDQETRAAAASNAWKIDSLEREMRRFDIYSENLRRVLAGEETVRLDSLIARIEAGERPDAPETLAAREAELRSEVLEAESQQPQSTAEETPLPLEGLSFFTPAPGVIAHAFDRNTHPSLDISVASGSSVHAVLDGTVVLGLWDDEYGYTIVLQHPGDLLSVYRRCSAMTRHAGDIVKAGAPIAITGAATDESEPQDILRFELWYRGAPVNPALYLHF